MTSSIGWYIVWPMSKFRKEDLMSCQVVTQAVHVHLEHCSLLFDLIVQKFIQLWSCALKHMVQWNETKIVVVVDTYKVDCWISHPYFDMSFISACNHLAIKLLQLPVMSSWTVLTVYIPSVLTIVCVLHVVPQWLRNLYWLMGLLLFVLIYWTHKFLPLAFSISQYKPILHSKLSIKRVIIDVSRNVQWKSQSGCDIG